MARRKQSFRPGAIDPIAHNRAVHRRKHPLTPAQQLAERFREIKTAFLAMGDAIKQALLPLKELGAALTPQPDSTPREELEP